MSLISYIKSKPKLKSFLKNIRNAGKNLSPAYRIRREVETLGAKILPDLTCIDIGASYYPHPAWELFRMSGKTNWVAVEPNEANLFYLNDWKWPASTRAVKTGLSEKGGRQTLYVTNVDSGSSLLEPVITTNMDHRIVSKDYFFPLRKVEIETITLDSVIEADQLSKSPILLKLDTQGSEFSILRGVDTSVFENRVICVELENTLLAEPIMKGSTPFYEVYSFMERMGFELVYLKPIQILAPVVNKNLKSAYVLNECDSVFLLRNSIVKERTLDFQLAMVGCYISYALYGEALDMLKHIAANTNSNPEIRSYCNAVIELLKS